MARQPFSSAPARPGGEPPGEGSLPRPASVSATSAAQRPVSGLSGPDALDARHPDGACPRTFDELIDEFSLHQFLVRNGEVLDRTPEFHSFRRKFFGVWPRVEAVIEQLVDLLLACSVPLALVHGERVVTLADDLELAALVDAGASSTRGAAMAAHTGALNLHGRKALRRLRPAVPSSRGKKAYPPIPREKLLGCLQNIVRAKHAAATKIQATWRMYQCRLAFTGLLVEDSAARTLQGLFRRWTMRRKFLAQLESKHAARLRAWRTLNREFFSNWDAVLAQRHVVVHVPSLSVEQSVRDCVHHHNVIENTQLARIFDIAASSRNRRKMPGTASDAEGAGKSTAKLNRVALVVYVSPFELPADVMAYHYRLLELGGVVHARRRVKFVHPENAAKLPTGLSLAQLVSLSPHCMRLIQTFVGNLPAFIVPNRVGAFDIQLAIELNLPMLSAEPELVAAHTSKGGSIAMFRRAGVPTPAGERNVTRAQIAPKLAALMVATQSEGVDVPRWLLKLDNSFGGRGIAYFDPVDAKARSHMNLIRSLPPSNRPPKTLIAHLEVLLARALPRRVAFAHPTLYSGEGGWERFLCEWARVGGGVIEACPEHVAGSPTVDIFVAPSGCVEVLCSHDQVFAVPYVCAGHAFPQSCASHAALCDAAEAVGQACFAQGLFGHFGIDFLRFYDESPSSQAEREAPSSGRRSRMSRSLMQQPPPRQAAATANPTGERQRPVRERARLAAVDLNAGTTPQLASFKAFHFLTRGRFDPRTGVYAAKTPPPPLPPTAVGAKTPFRAQRATRRRRRTAADRAKSRRASGVLAQISRQLRGTVAHTAPRLSPGSESSDADGDSDAAALSSDEEALESELRELVGSSVSTFVYAPPARRSSRRLLQQREHRAEHGHTHDNRYHAGATTAPSDTELNTDSGANKASPRASEQPPPPPHRRFYCAVPYLYQPNLALMQHRPFFRACLLSDITFDLREKVGTAFFLMDSLACGAAGLLSTGRTSLQAMEHMSHALSFLLRHVSNLRLDASSTAFAAESTLAPLAETVRYVVRARRQQVRALQNQREAQRKQDLRRYRDL